MQVAKFKTVDEYIAAAPKQMQSALRELRKAIKAAAPQAEESISYGMAAYKQNGRLVYFGAFQNHGSFFPASKSIIVMFEKELKDFETSAGTIRFTADHPLLTALVKKMVKERLRQNNERAAAK